MSPEVMLLCSVACTVYVPQPTVEMSRVPAPYHVCSVTAVWMSTVRRCGANDRQTSSLTLKLDPAVDGMDDGREPDAEFTAMLSGVVLLLLPPPPAEKAVGSWYTLSELTSQ